MAKPSPIHSFQVVVVVLLFAFHAFSCAKKDTYVFDIPKGSAQITLKVFATQANAEIVFNHSGDLLVKTNAVKGSMTSDSALAMMLEDTGLSFVRDQQTRAFAVSFSDP